MTTLVKIGNSKGSFKINLGGTVRRPATANSKVINERTLREFVFPKLLLSRLDWPVGNLNSR